MAVVMGRAICCSDAAEVGLTYDDSGWLIVKYDCGCVTVYGRYQGIGSRNVMYSDVCERLVESCDECGYMKWPHNDCLCHLAENSNDQ